MLDARVAALEADMREVKGSLGRIEAVLGKIEARMDRLDERLRKVEIDVASSREGVLALPTTWTVLTAMFGMAVGVTGLNPGHHPIRSFELIGLRHGASRHDYHQDTGTRTEFRFPLLLRTK